jgi:hypothetical protein
VISGGDPKWGGPSYWFSRHFWAYLAYADSIWVAGPGAAVLAVPGWWANRGRSWRLLGASWACTLLLYYLIVARYAGGGQGLQYHLYAAPLLSLMAGRAIDAAVQALANPRWAGSAVCMAVIALQVPQNIHVIRQRGGVLLREAGLSVARLSSPSDMVLVLSNDQAIDRGVPNNYQQPDVFFHAHRRGRVLAIDLQTAADFERELGFGPVWFVNFPSLNQHAHPSFREALERTTQPAGAGPGYEVRRIRPLGQGPSPGP